jgi:hypothetical protein
VITDLAEVARLGMAKSAENLQIPALPGGASPARRNLSGDRHSSRGAHRLHQVRQPLPPLDCQRARRRGNRMAVFLSMDEAAVIQHYTATDAESQARTPRTRCRIYPARPEACRNFPQVAPGTHSLGSRLESHSRWTPLCPIPFNAFEEYKHLVGFPGGT